MTQERDLRAKLKTELQEVLTAERFARTARYIDALAEVLVVFVTIRFFINTAKTNATTIIELLAVEEVNPEDDSVMALRQEIGKAWNFVQQVIGERELPKGGSVKDVDTVDLTASGIPFIALLTPEPKVAYVAAALLELEGLQTALLETEIPQIIRDFVEGDTFPKPPGTLRSLEIKARMVEMVKGVINASASLADSSPE